jgi:hypothetical protein
MSDRKAIESICMILPISEEEVEQENHQLSTPHNWHNITTTIIKKIQHNLHRRHQHGQRKLLMPTQHTTKLIRILQINTQHSNYKTHMILNKTAGKYDLLLIQEPWIGNISGGNRGPPAHKAWKLYIPIQTIRQGDRPCNH